jgi:branched-chain amino acid transport system substrate-binding protein
MDKKVFDDERGKINRRTFLKGAAALGGAAAWGGVPALSRTSWAQAKKPIKLGGLYDLTGPFATESEDQRKATQMVVDEYNNKGGLLGRPIELIVRDSKLKTDEAALKAKELVEKEKIELAIGTLGAHTVVAYNIEGKKHNIPLMGICQTDDLNKMPDWGPYTFHEGFTPYMTAQAEARWIMKNLGTKWYFLIGQWAWGQQVYNSYVKFMAKNPGITNLGKSDYPLGGTEYSMHFTKIMDAKPEVLITTGFGKDHTNQAKQMTDFGLKGKMKIFFVLTDLMMAKEAGQASMAGMHAGTHFYWEFQDTIPTAKPFVEAFVKRWGRPPTGYGGYAYGGARELLGAVERAGSLDPEKIRKQLEGRSYDNYKGKQWWRKCDHQSMQDWYILKGREPKDVKKEWAFFDVLGKTDADEKLERTCEELGFKG